MSTRSAAMQKWVEEVTELTKPDQVYWCDGSEEEYQRLIDQMLASGDMIKLNQESYPNCYLHRQASFITSFIQRSYICG